MSDQAPIDMYIAAYSDKDAAQADWDALKQIAASGAITVDALVLVERDADGKIKVKDNAHEVGAGAVIGAVGGAVIGLIFPPALIASAAVGAGVGAGAGKLLDHHMKNEIKADVEEELPPNSSGIVALFEEQWVNDVKKALANADNLSTREVDPGSVDDVKANATQAEPVK